MHGSVNVKSILLTFFVGCIPMRYERFRDEIWERFINVKGTSHFLFLYIYSEQQRNQVDLIFLFPLL